MATLEDITRGAAVQGMFPDGIVSVVDVCPIGSDVLQLTYKDSQGKLGNELIYRHREIELKVLETDRDAQLLDAEAWELCVQSSDKYSLLVVDAAAAPLAITGNCLREMRERGWSTLYPAKCRIVYEQCGPESQFGRAT